MKRRILLIALAAALAVLLCGAGIYAYLRMHAASAKPQDQQGYVIKSGKVYYRTTMDVTDGAAGYHTVVNDQELKDASAKTFVSIDPYWAKDSDTLFYMGQTVAPAEGTQAADLSMFTLIGNGTGLGKDSHAVYLASPNQDGWTYAAIPEADPATFTLVEGGQYATDKNNAYYLDLPFDVKKIQGAEGSSFAVLGQCAAVEVSREYYAEDAKSVIAGDTILPGTDRETFKIVAGFDSGPDGMYVAGAYAVDKNHVYKNCGEIVPTGKPDLCGPEDIAACE